MVASADDVHALPGQPVSPTDLLWALRGGGAGTAAVYEWTVKTYPAPKRVVVCSQTFSAASAADTAAFVDALFNDWDPAHNLDGATYPSCKFYFAATDWNQVQLTGWDVDAATVGATLAAGMARAGTAVGPPDCRAFDDWFSYLVYMSIESYYGQAAADAGVKRRGGGGGGARTGHPGARARVRASVNPPAASPFLTPTPRLSVLSPPSPLPLLLPATPANFTLP